jgi:creatinine amidohydrolase/Fe(II)-dependent formamide hydrolase-like protein
MIRKPVYKMLPHEIIEARDRSACAFIPISPSFEWHSYHLPVGTDALISEAISMYMADRVNGIYFRPLSLGLDEFRSEEDLTTWGFQETETIFGMQFPDLPLSSEYCTPVEMRKCIENRLAALKNSGFKYAFLVNHHLGAGQLPLLENIALEITSDNFKVFSVPTYQFLTYQHEFLSVGGHAGQSETLFLMAFLPELVDLTQLPDGTLEVKTSGILHDQPTIGEEHHPNKVTLVVANLIHKNILDNFERFVRESIDTT